MLDVRSFSRWVVVAFLVGASLSWGPGAQSQKFLEADQGWSDVERADWYGATQGSRLIPEAWLLALEQPDADAMFLDDAHITSLRFLPRSRSGDAIALPVGFAVDVQDDRRLGRTKLRWRANQGDEARWVGLNCSACHTGEITFRGRPMRIDGGQTLADFQLFMNSLLRSLRLTRDDPARWERFSRRVLRDSTSFSTDQPMLIDAFRQYIIWLETHQRMNDTGGIRYGFGRLDAFGHIYNQVVDIVNPSGGVAGNPPNAPVSYPFIWNINRLTHVQYNAIAANRRISGSLSGSGVDAGALARNTGEVIGVFGDVVVPQTPGPLGLVSSVQVRSLVALEQQLARLRPPRWPAHLHSDDYPMKIDDRRAARGAVHFSQHCAGCHLPMRGDQVPRRLSTFMDQSNPANAPNADIWRDGPRNSKPGTDIWMACNAFSYRSSTGRLVGLPSTYAPVLGGAQMRSHEPLATILTAVVAGTLLNAGDDVLLAVVQSFFVDLRPRVFPSPPPAPVVGVEDPRAEAERRCRETEDMLLGYKARPLDGIWATGPFLHNGSVPNLYELLRSPSNRSASFPIGTREFDPIRVGFSISPDAVGNSQRFNTRDSMGREIRGNSNSGHDYGNENFTDDERYELIEYMKTL